MAKPWKKKKRPRMLKGQCAWREGDTQCASRKVQRFTCITCEDLAAAGKRRVDEVFYREACAAHRGEILDAVKRHALIAHPTNLLRATVAALKGDL